MESANPWRQISLCAGRLTLAASLAPTAAAVGYGIGRSYGAATAMLLPCGALFVAALLTLVVAAIAGGRHGTAGLGLLAIAVASVLTQFVLLATISMVRISAR